MKTTKLRTKRVILPAIAGAAVIAVGGPVWAATADDDDPRGGERDRIASAAIKAVGGGTAVDVESSDDGDEAYEVEVRAEDGTETDVALDKDLTVLSKDVDDRDGDEQDEDDDDRTEGEGRDGDDRALSAKERTSAEKAARTAVGGGEVLDVEASDDRGEAYEAEVRDSDGTEWDVELDSKYKVLDKTADN